MPRDRSPVREARQEIKSLLGIIDDQIKRIFDCMRPTWTPWTRTNEAELKGTPPINPYTREEQERFEELAREQDRRRSGLTGPLTGQRRNETPSRAMARLMDELNNINPPTTEPPEDLGVVTDESHDDLQTISAPVVNDYVALLNDVRDEIATREIRERLVEIPTAGGAEPAEPHFRYYRNEDGSICDTETGQRHDVGDIELNDEGIMVGIWRENGLQRQGEITVRAGETITRGDPVVVESHSSPTSPKMRLTALKWDRRDAEADFSLALECRLPETMQTLTGKMIVDYTSFERLRGLMNNWPGEYSIIIARNLEFKILDGDDHEIAQLKFDQFGIEDDEHVFHHGIDPTNILASPHIRGMARADSPYHESFRQIPVPHLVFEIDEPSAVRTINLFGQVFGMSTQPYGESAVAPLRKQKYPPMECVLCEDVIDEPENMRTFLGPRQMVKYLKACKHLNQQPQLFCCKCFGIIKSKPKFMKTYTAMMNSYKAFKKAEAEARKVLK